MNTTTTKRDTGRNTAQEPSQTRQLVMAVGAVVAIIAVVIFFLSRAGIVGGPDPVKGYYVLQVNPASGAPPDKVSGDMVWGFERLGLSADHTFSLGHLVGTWGHSGSTITLNPQTVPPPDQFYANTTMGDALSIMRQQCRFTISADGKTLTATDPKNGPVVWSKISDGLN